MTCTTDAEMPDATARKAAGTDADADRWPDDLDAVLVGDDRSLAAALDEAGLSVRCAPGPGELPPDGALPPDLVLVLVGDDPLTAVRELRRSRSMLHPIVVLAPTAAQAGAALRAGAMSYLVVGDTTPEEVVDAVGTRTSRLSPLAVQSLVDEARIAPQCVEVELTEREQAILDLVARGMSNAEIGRTLFLADKTIRNNLSVVYSKLQVRGRPQAIVRWLNAGGGGPTCPG